LTRVLVVDDDAALRAAVGRALRLEGFEVDVAADGGEALDRMDVSQPAVILLDVLMPQVDGVAMVRFLRERGDRTPVLMLTAREGTADKVAGLDAGADDYLPKPFALEELLARVRALARRGGAIDGGRLVFGDLELELAAREVRRAGRLIELTRTEFSLLETLMRNPRVVLPRETLFERVWGYRRDFASNSLDVYIGYRGRLRAEAP
jgi:two-component system response regulator MprA